MLAHLLASHNAPFLWALVAFAALGALQLVSLLIGSELFSFMDDALPDADLDADAGDVDASLGPLEGALSLLGIGKVPAILSVLIVLFWFSFLGYNLQLTLAHLFDATLSPGLAAVIAFAGALPLLRLGNEICARILPRDETLAVSESTFVGKLAIITIGTVTHERASEARLQDEHGHTHYVQVVADEPDATFSAGEEVILVGRRGTRFTIVPGPSRLLEE